MELPEQLSLNVASVIAIATVQSPEPSSLVLAVTSEAAVTVGSIGSVTTTVIEVTFALPYESNTNAVTVFEPKSSQS